MITNGPVDTTVCDGDTASITCGFSSADPGGVIITWRVTTRSNNGIVSESNISASSIRNDSGDRLQWVLDLNSPSSSYLRVGPVNQTYDRSAYQCIILRSIGNNIISETGTLTVAGKFMNM